MKKLIRFLLGLAACGVLVYAAVNLTDYIQEGSRSRSLNDDLIEGAVTVKDPAPVRQSETEQADTAEPCETAGDMSVSNPAVQQEGDQSGSLNDGPPDETTAAENTASPTSDTKEQKSAEDEVQYSEEIVPVEVDFEFLWETNKDVVGWIYCEDTPINYPVVQAEDNDYYLHRLMDGTWNSSGTLFVDCRNANDFSDANTVIYGHNMKNKSMFGTLQSYKKQAYFEEHPIMWLLMPGGSYKVELIAGCAMASTSEIYSLGQTEEDVFVLVKKIREQSTFVSGFQFSPEDRYVTLSTCSYEYDDARYVLIGKLIPV